MAPKTLRVHFSDACTDVLVWLADQPRGTAFTIAGIDAGTAPPDADDTRQTISSSLRTLYDCGLVEHVSFEGIGMWRATDAGRKAVADGHPAPVVLPDGCVDGHSPDLVNCELGVDWP